MNWDAAGAIGEILGALLVVATLVYLSRQIRQQGSAATSGAMGSWLSDYNDWVLAPFGDADSARLIQEGLTNFNGLDRERQLRFHFWIVAHVLSKQVMYLQTRDNTMHLDLADAELTFTASMLKLPGGYQWWETGRSVFNPEFVDEMDERISRTPPVSEAWPWFTTKDG